MCVPLTTEEGTPPNSRGTPFDTTVFGSNAGSGNFKRDRGADSVSWGLLAPRSKENCRARSKATSMSSSCRHSGFVVYRTKVTPNWLLKVQRARRARQHQRRTQTEATVNRTLLEEANSCPTEPCPRTGLVVSPCDHTLHGTPRDVHTTEESESNKMSKFTTRSIPRGTISRTHDSSISERSPQDSPIRCPNRRRCHRARQRPRHTRSRTHPPTSSKSYNRLRSILPSTGATGRVVQA